MEIGFIGLGNMGGPMAQPAEGWPCVPVSSGRGGGVKGARPGGVAAAAATWPRRVVTMLPADA